MVAMMSQNGFQPAVFTLVDHRKLFSLALCSLSSLYVETLVKSSDVLVSEWVSWALLFSCVEVCCLVRRRRGNAKTTVYDEVRTYDMELLVAGAIVLASVCQQESSVGWIMVC